MTCEVPGCGRSALAWGVCAEHRADEICVAWAWAAPEEPPRRPAAPVVVRPLFTEGRATSRGEGALRRAAAELAGMASGTRNNTLSRVTYFLAGVCAAGHLDERVARELVAAAAATVARNAMERREFLTTVRSAWRSGAHRPLAA